MVRRLSNSHDSAKTLTLSDSRFDFAIDFLEDTSQYGIGTTTLQQDGEPLVTLSHSIRTRFNEQKEDFFYCQFRLTSSIFSRSWNVLERNKQLMVFPLSEEKTNN